MTSSRVANDLAAVLLPVGVVGAVLAALCAIVAAVAIARGAGGLAGGAVGVWIPFAMLSFAASFANQWMPLLVAAGSLAAMLVIGAVARVVLTATEPERSMARTARAELVAEAAVGVADSGGSVSRSSSVLTHTTTGAVPTLA